MESVVRYTPEPETKPVHGGGNEPQSRPAGPRKVAFYGLFGQQNWGNECTLQAIIHNVRNRFPDAELRCFCTGPADTSRRYEIPAFPISDRFASGYPKAPRKRAHPLVRLLRRAFIALPRELLSWIKAYKSLGGFDMLIVPGTGLLTDYTSNPLGIPYRILKWSIIARLCRSKLLFVSVGAGPMYHPATKWILKAALSLAEYRSYRDDYSKHFLEGIGFKAGSDPVYPDLAFSLPPDLFLGRTHPPRNETVVGVGVKDYRGVLGLPGREGEAKYQGFINKLGTFVAWLIENRYKVRLLIGDSLYDNQVKEDLLGFVKTRTANGEDRHIINEPIASLEDLLSQLAASDIVVSARFHNLLLALMLNKPVLSMSYHGKFAALMAGVGLGDYCQDIDELDVGSLTRQLVRLEKEASNLRPIIKQRVEAHRDALNEQYSRIFR